MSGREAKITIQGVELTHAQAMTVRVAVSSCMGELNKPGALGADPQGEATRRAYIERLREIALLLLSARHAPEDTWTCHTCKRLFRGWDACADVAPGDGFRCSTCAPR